MILQDTVVCDGHMLMRQQAAAIRVKVDDSPGKTPGWKFNHWEMRGVPVRIEVWRADMWSVAITGHRSALGMWRAARAC